MASEEVSVMIDEVPSPSEFMRMRRPEQFSDSSERSLYRLSRDVLEQRLENLTARNDMQAFERFAKALCERFVCPFLKPATGPEGGGDGKVDTESIMTAEEVVERHFEGRADRGNERWGFAFSTKKDWKAKARADVAGMVGTGRGYKTAFFVTSRYARSKDRSELQDALAAEHGILVEILDRNWIVDNVIEKDARDLAHIHLGIGEKVEESKIGPRDRERRERLASLDRELEAPERAAEAPLAVVKCALDAAILSRELERPRYETDGRFERAIRLADRHGADRHSLAARYEKLWTALHWFDDIGAVRDGYRDIEERALALNHASAIERATNLLFGLSGPFAQATSDGVAVDVQAAWERLEASLESMWNDETRPNNRLTARTLLLMRGIMVDLAASDLSSIETRLSQIIEIIDAARGLMEYDFDRLEQLVEMLGETLGGNATLSSVVNHLGDALQQRRGETARGMLFLRRARQLDIERDRFEVIRRLGTVVECLTKEEHLDELVEAAYLLAVAYRGAGLPWAARATALFGLSAIVIQAEKSSVPPSEILPTFLLLGWIDLELGLVAELLDVVAVSRGILASLPFDEDSKNRARETLQTFDFSLGGQFLNAREADLSAFQNLPDVLMATDLPAASTCLLYALGHEDEALGPAIEDRATNLEMLAQLSAQPACALPRHGLIGEFDGPFALTTDVLGLQLTISGDKGARCALVAQLLISMAETMLATAFEAGFAAHRERYEVRVMLSDVIAAPCPKFDETASQGLLEWPADWNPAVPRTASDARDALLTTVASIIGRTCFLKDGVESLETLLDSDTAISRITTSLGLGVSMSRVMKETPITPAGIVDHFRADPPRSFPFRAVLPLPEVSAPEGPTSDDTMDQPFGVIRSHRELKTRSLIDVPLWNAAKWRGVAVMKLSPVGLPILALMFENSDAGYRIFEAWRERLGSEDEASELLVTIVTDLPGHLRSHYAVILTTNLEARPVIGEMFFVVARSLIMEPSSGENLQLFLRDWGRNGAFLIGGASMPQGAKPPELRKETTILKRHLRVVRHEDLEVHEVGFLGSSKEV